MDNPPSAVQWNAAIRDNLAETWRPGVKAVAADVVRAPDSTSAPMGDATDVLMVATGMMPLLWSEA